MKNLASLIFHKKEVVEQLEHKSELLNRELSNNFTKRECYLDFIEELEQLLKENETAG